MLSRMNPLPFRSRERARSRFPGGRPLTLLLGMALWAALVPGFAGTAGAQEAPVADVRLVGQQIHHGLDDRLNIQVRVTNLSETPLSGLTLQAAVFPKVPSRTELHDSFADVTTETPPLAPSFDVGGTLGPGESTPVDIDPKLSDFLFTTVEGVYPIQITLFADSGEQLDAFKTPLILYPERPEIPLNFTLMVPVSPLPARGPDGHFAPDEEGEWPLETALSDEGWMSGLIDALDVASATGLQLGVAPSPRVMDEIADMANGYTKVVGGEVERIERDSPAAIEADGTLEQLRSVLTRPGVQPVLSAYAGPDLPTMPRELDLEHLFEQFSEGEETLRGLLPDAQFRPQWLYATGSRWDADTLGTIRDSRPVGEDLRTFVGAEFFDPRIDDTAPTCPDPGTPDADLAHSFTCPVEIATGDLRTQAYVREADLQDRFADLAERGGDALDLQRFFAETAFIHLEFPGTPERIVHTTMPAHWEPKPYVSQRLLSGLARAPWLTSRTPASGMKAATDPLPRDLIPTAPDLRGQPDEADFETIRRTADRLETYRELGPPQERLDRMDHNLLVAVSRTWWNEPPLSTQEGIAYAEDTEDEIIGEFDKLTVSGPNTTLTSQRSAIEVNVFNETTYPVTVDVDFFAQGGDIRIDESDKEELDNLTVEPGAAPAIKVDAIAESSGIFNVRARILSPVTRTEINSQELTIRSTNFNQIALGITFGALAFLILFYILRLISRRRRASDTTTESTPS